MFTKAETMDTKEQGIIAISVGALPLCGDWFSCLSG